MVALFAVVAGACRSRSSDVVPVIEFTKLPPAGEGSPNRVDPIEGRVKGERRGQRIVLYARAGVWWVQPLANRPFTEIRPDLRWQSWTHPGTEYAALLVDPGYHPPLTVNSLPDRGDRVAAVATADATMLAHPGPKALHFSGYDWEIRQTSNNPGGSPNLYDPKNAWVDKGGFLHLRIVKHVNEWASAEVTLSQSLGYGSYRFVVRDISHLEPAVVLNLSVWDNSAPPREADVEISRWGEMASKNAQYVMQPYYVAENAIRFGAPGATLTHFIDWQPDRVSFKTDRGNALIDDSEGIASHVFTSGIPLPGNDLVHMNLYVFESRRNPLEHGTEVVIEKFEFLP